MEKERIKIKCYSCNSRNRYSYHLFVYNSKHHLLVDKHLKKDGSISFTLPYFGIYKIKIIQYNGIEKSIYYTPFLYTKTGKRHLYFSFFNKNDSFFHPITINITDKNYEGLFIKKGEIRLWPNLT